MRTLAMALTLAFLLPALPSAAADTIDPVEPVMCSPIWECITPTIQRCQTTYYAQACAGTDAYGCVVVSATAYSRPVIVSGTVPGQDVWTPAVNAGPAHVGSTHVWTDPVYVGPYTYYTPSRYVSNTLCSGEYVGPILA